MANLSPLALTIITSVFAFFVTTLGGAVVFCFKNINKICMQLILSFSAGIMIASSFFSLIEVAIKQSETYGQNSAFVCTLGISLGMIFMIVMEVFVDKLLSKNNFTNQNKQALLSTFAISLHNIPEGLCIGVVFASAGVAGESAIMSAILLAVGIAIQNFPEGSSVSLPLYNSGFSKLKSFLLAIMSGIVEPIFAVIGYIFTGLVSFVLPVLLTFAAGTMVCVSCIDLIPESLNSNKNIATLGLCSGFCLMMFLDLLL